MGMNITQMPCNLGNYTARRSSAIRYLVIHYTGAPGTARNNGAYFASWGDIGASAHYFVDAQDIVQSVPDSGRAWHCGASAYKHPECRNDNSIGVELCCYQDAAGRWRFEPENTPALWTEICESHAGTEDDPIPYSGNMALEYGKYYIQDGAVYRCTRDTINPVYNALADLVGLYVEKV